MLFVNSVYTSRQETFFVANNLQTCLEISIGKKDSLCVKKVNIGHVHY